MGMKKTHWKKFMNPNYLGAYELEPGKDLILTFASVGEEEIVGTDGKKEIKLVARFKEPVKPMILNATNCKTITKVHKTAFVEDWIGKRVQLYAETVKAFGDVVEALRVRPVVPAATKPKLAADRFAKMLEQISSGQFQADAAFQKFDLTPEQIEAVQAAIPAI